MKKATIIILSILLLALLFFIFRSSLSGKITRDFSFDFTEHAVASPTPYQQVVAGDEDSESVFVPYWTLANGIDTKEKRLIYFGITPTTSGINRTEEGFQNLGQFMANTSQENERLLTLRMLSQEVNFDILEDPRAQSVVISDSIVLAKEYGFDGIVLDLELKALPFDSVVTQINEFVSTFYTATKATDVTFSVLVYGDTFYRVRPFDVKHIAANSDEVMVMAYDFHKSGGNPGPNFPKNGSEKYGYDYLELMDDFLNVVPAEKLTVVFGLFGYDWPVDSENVSTGTGEALSFYEIKSGYLDSCPSGVCSVKRDDLSTETSVVYTDSDGQKHVVWFEDMKSVEAKKKLLKERGINSFSYWAHSYY